MIHSIESRIVCNKHVASDLRRRLEKRHAKGSQLRDTIDRLSDTELLDMYMLNEQLGREYATKRLDEKGSSE